MKVGSLFAGIGGFDLGFERAGFEVAWCVEWDKNAQTVLRRRFPNAQVYGDIREVDPDKLERVDVICGGFPCQDLSVAGKRAGLAGERSGLFHDAMRIVRQLRPSVLVLENVPGLLSSNRGLDFATVLREVGEGWDCAEVGWRVLDSQYFGVAQRRRRVFVVAGARAGCAEQILALAEGGGGDPPSRDKAREDAPSDALGGTAVGRWWDGSDCSATLTKQNANGSQRMPDKGNLGAVVIDRAAFNQGTNAAYDPRIEQSGGQSLCNQFVDNGCCIPGEVKPIAFGPGSFAQYVEVEGQCSTLRAAGGDLGGGSETIVVQPTAIQGNLIGRDQGGPHGVGAREDGTMYTLTKTDIHAVAFRKSKRAQTEDDDETGVDDGLANTLNGSDTGDTRTTHAVAFGISNQPTPKIAKDICPSLDAKAGGGGRVEAVAFNWQNGGGYGNANDALGIPSPPAVCASTIVRRLTPVECERLQGFPDGWTQIGTDKPTADTHRYKQLGNAVTVNVAEWIARRTMTWLVSR